MKEITKELLERFRAREAERKELKTLHAAAAKTELQDLAYVPEAAARLNGDFAIELKTRGVTWQQKSGRCWLYAVLNILRERVSERCKLDKFELSANYLSFYDKLEKANNFLEFFADREKFFYFGIMFFCCTVATTFLTKQNSQINLIP